MAQHKQAEKRHRQSLKRKQRNTSTRSKMKSAVRTARETLSANDREAAPVQVAKAIKVIQTTASKGVIHKRAAARRMSRMMKALNKLDSSKA